jgi:transcriptional regulator of stress and heat shock response
LPRLSDIIEEFIKELLSGSENDMLEIQRNELASQFGCAPSQINYVLMTRFTVDKGYYIESKRGGGGSIRITKASIDNNEYFRNLILGKIGRSITQNTAESYIDAFLEHKLITEREASIMKVVVNDKSINLPPQDRDFIRANILKSMMIVLIN